MSEAKDRATKLLSNAEDTLERHPVGTAVGAGLLAAGAAYLLTRKPRDDKE